MGVVVLKRKQVNVQEALYAQHAVIAVHANGVQMAELVVFVLQLRKRTQNPIYYHQ